MASYNQVFGVSDPTSTQTVWAGQYAGVRQKTAMIPTLPYTWVVGLGGMIVTRVLSVITVSDGLRLESAWQPGGGEAVVLAHGITADLDEQGLFVALAGRPAAAGFSSRRAPAR